MDGMKIVGDSVRRGKDVSPAGRESRGDEEGGRLPAAIHGGEKKRSAILAENGRIVMATVKGDVHDIGKTSWQSCSGATTSEVIDLGVMVPLRRRFSRRHR